MFFFIAARRHIVGHSIKDTERLTLSLSVTRPTCINICNMYGQCLASEYETLTDDMDEKQDEDTGRCILHTFTSVCSMDNSEAKMISTKLPCEGKIIK